MTKVVVVVIAVADVPVVVVVVVGVEVVFVVEDGENVAAAVAGSVMSIGTNIAEPILECDLINSHFPYLQISKVP